MVGRRRSLHAILGLLNALLGRAHDISSLGFIPAPPGQSWAARARVVLFIHVPKCGGTSVRDIFRWHNWSMTYWSNSQRLTGWKANRLLANIRSYLARNDTRIFVEWHLDYNISFVPDLERYVRIMRPDVVFRSFIIVREPTRLVTSTAAYGGSDMPPELFIRMKSEYLLVEALHPPVAGPGCTISGNCIHCDEGTKCAKNKVPDCCAPYRRANGNALCRQSAWETFCANATRFTKGSRAEAAQLVEERANRLAVLSDSSSCEQFIEDTIRRLSLLDAVLLLDNGTMPIIHAMAHEALLIGPPSDTASLKLGFRAPKSAHSLRRKRAPYERPAMKALLQEENTCSSRLYARLQARMTGSWWRPRADVWAV